MLCGALQFELRTFDTLIVGTITEPLKYSFVNFLEKEKKGRKDRPSDILQAAEDENKLLPPTCNKLLPPTCNKLLSPTCKVCIDLFSLMKHFISTFNTNGMRKKYSI